MKPLCFVLMPFGRKADAMGKVTNFDLIYEKVIAPGLRAAELDSIRADEEQVGGAIHKPMFERLMLCDYAVADLTGANPNVYYELGVRHALRPRSTVILFAEGTSLPFDLAPLRGLPYGTDASGAPRDAGADAAALTRRLVAARDEAADDSPLFQLIGDMPRPAIDHRKTDVFRQNVVYAQGYKDRLEAARRQGLAAVRDIAAELNVARLSEIEAAVIIDLFLSFRAVSGHAEMVDLVTRMPPPLQRTRMVQEQLGFALNRLKRHAEAEAVLKEVIRDFGPSSETNGLLGRVYKDLWDAAAKAGDPIAARGHLRAAIAAYVAGFEADWRDAYPGVNAVTLMEMGDKPDPRQAELLPLVRYAATRASRGDDDYWSHATLVELAVLARDMDSAETHLADALTRLREGWEAGTTARNLGLIAERRRARGEDAANVEALAGALLKAQARKEGKPLP